MAKYQAYAEYKDSGAEWLGSIPKHWSVEYSKWLFEERNNKANVGDEMLTASQKYGVIPQKMFMELEQQKVVQVQLGHEILKHAEVNDFVISMRSFQGGIEYCGYKGAVSSAYVPLKPRQDLSLSYYRYLFKSIPYIQALQTTTNLVRDGQALRFANFIQVRIPLLPYSEAEKIGQFLDHETSKIDHLIEKQQQLIELLKEKRQAVISHAVTKGLNPNVKMKDSGVEWLGEVPERWDTTKIKYVAELTPKKSEVSSNDNRLCTFVPMEKLKLGSLIKDEEKPISEVIGGYTYFKNGDLLLAKVTPCFENKNMVVASDLKNGIGFGSSEIYVLRTNHKVNTQFLYYRLQEDQFMELGTGAMTGAGGLKRVPSEFLNNFEFALPPLSEQIAITKYLNQYLIKNEYLMNKAQSAIQLMQERRTALISAAVTGKIDVRNWQAPTLAEAHTELNA